ncbi:HAD family hydrolase [Listeria ilorinensis]|uniref:HAD family hydrolase n=1 Tax=Listeria ilorinensis TaxID=2867439 RepID=UPI001EF5A274|nr:HAD family hydrolase [Listeria ilorinensis]
MLKAIIMDFDGLIVDTEVVWYKIFQDWFRENHHYELPVNEFLQCVGASSKRLFDQLAAEKGIVVDDKRFAEETKQSFIQRSAQLPAKEGVRDFIIQVKDAGLKLALATSSKREKPQHHLTRLKLLPYFDVLVTAEDVAKIKPAPDLFLKAAEQLGATNKEALIIEDSENGLRAGRAAEIPVVVVPNEVTKYSIFHGAYLELASLAEVDLDNWQKSFGGDRHA